MSLRARLVGFTCCVLVGTALCGLAYSTVTVSPRSFGLLYSFANISFLCGYAWLLTGF